MEKLCKYLFCYFTGNRPDEESVHFALSEDGYSFHALNGNKPVIKQMLGKKCSRDPFLFRDEEGIFHIIATDMRSDDGWCSNDSMVMWDSRDLIHWENERIFDFTVFEKTKTAHRVWAPEVIYDKFKKEYMIYWSHQNKDCKLSTITWYIYTKDFKTFTTEPDILFKPEGGLAGIDADIIEKDGKYYMYRADELKDAICCAVSERPSGPYHDIDEDKVSFADTALEGNCIYKILGTDKYALIADQFHAGGYFMQESTDMIHFTAVPKSKFIIDHIRPRHGSMLHITQSEYDRLVETFGMSV